MTDYIYRVPQLRFKFDKSDRSLRGSNYHCFVLECFVFILIHKNRGSRILMINGAFDTNILNSHTSSEIYNTAE